MSLICESCGARNPENNRFCGQCGHQVSASWNDLPEEFWREPTAAGKAEADLSREALDFDKKIPLTAPQRHETLQRTPLEPHDNRVLTAAEDRPQDTQPRVTENADHPVRTGISGPSFLGLTDDEPSSTGDSYTYDDQYGSPSHLRRNLVLALLAVVAVLVGLQWRTIRSHGAAFLPGFSRNHTAANAAAKQSAATASANTNPTPNANPTAQPAKDKDDTSAESHSPASGAATPHDQHPPAMANAAESKTADTTQAAAHHDAKVEDTAAKTAGDKDAESSDTTKSSTAEHATHKARTETAEKTAPKPAAAASTPARNTPPGDEELRHAARASDSEARAAWLWRAVAKGNSQAPVELAKMYELGDGVPQNCNQAGVLLRLAANKGNQEAGYELRRIHSSGCR